MAGKGGEEIEGTCMEMCPVQEIGWREKNNLLHYFEMVPGTERQKIPKANPKAMVKEYTRPAAGKEDARLRELRPLTALLKSVDYLIDSIVPRTDRPWNFVYDYVFDRLRAVRRDMVIQRHSGPVATTILEKIIRFHMYSSYRLALEPMAKFDPKINDTHLQECMKRLLVLYDTGGTACQTNMAEFTSLYLLYNAGSTEALLYGITQRRHLHEKPVFRLSLEIGTSVLLKNYVRVFRLCCKLTPVLQCALSPHIPRLQSDALRIMSSGFHSKALRYDITSLSKLLLYDDERDLQHECESRFLSVNGKGVLFDKNDYSHLEKVPNRKYRFIDESLRTVSMADLIHGPQRPEAAETLTTMFNKLSV